jgi:hypothetical protein
MQKASSEFKPHASGRHPRRSAKVPTTSKCFYLGASLAQICYTCLVTVLDFSGRRIRRQIVARSCVFVVGSVNENRHFGWRGRVRRPFANPPWTAHLLLALPVAACSATSSVDHSPAEFAPIQSSLTVDADRDVVFERLTRRLPEAGFALVEIDDGLQLVRASLTTDQPDAYVDLGHSRRTFEGIWGPVESFEYAPATSASYKLTSYDGVPLQATRDVALKALATIRTRPQGAMTEVSVDVSYDLSARIGYHELGMFGSPTGEVQTVAGEIHFQTAEPGTGDEEVALCMSNGKLEAQILNLAT